MYFKLIKIIFKVFSCLLLLIIIKQESIAQSGSALNFEGVNDYVNIISNSGIPKSGPVSVEAWINYTSGGGNLTWFKKGSTNGYGLYVSNNVINVITYGVINWNTNVTLTAGTWNHIVFTYDGTTQRIFKNGVLSASIAAGYLTATNDAFIGANFTGFEAGYFRGSVDEVRIWNRAISQCEIQSNMNCEFVTQKNGMVAYYKFNQGLSGGINTDIHVLKDEGDNNMNGTLTNFNLTGTNSNWIAQGGVITGASCTQTRVSIFITSGLNTVCTGSSVTFTAVPNNGGTAPLYQWIKNGVNIAGANASTLTISSLVNNDVIRCVLTNNTSCTTPVVVYSNSEKMDIASSVYTFTGSGDWDLASNWSNNSLPPPVLPKCSQIIIDPSPNGECILNVQQIVSSGATLIVQPGKKFKVLGDLIINDNLSSYFADTTTNKGFGAERATAAERQNIPYVEDLDTSLIQTFARYSSTQSSTILNVPPPRAQGQIGGSCVGWAIGYGVLGFYNNILERNSSYDGFDKLTSPTYIWNQLNNHVDKGISIPSAFNLVTYQGCCKWFDMPGTVSYLESPSQAARDNAANYSYTEIKCFQFTTVNIDLIKSYLNRNCVLPFVCKVDAGFESGGKAGFYVKPDGRFVWMNYVETIIGQHAMVVCGYDDNIQAFKVLNSWGTSWGNNGFIWIDYNFFKRAVLTDFYFFNPELYVVIPKRAELTITTTPITQITSTSASSGYNITYYGSNSVFETGICYSSLRNPTTAWGLNSNTIVSSTGTATISGLLTGVRYYVRSYAKTNKGIVYGNEDSIMLQDSQLATLATSPITSITSTSAISGGTITNDGGSPISSRGVCWNITANPSVANNKTNEGGGTGAFTSNLSGLIANTTYYIKAYATNIEGIAYGNEVRFTTEQSQDSTFTDPRDGQVYKFRHIGTQVWMTLNLNYNAIGSWCYDTSSNKCAIYGRLYDWNVALNVAPPGWHLPSDSEWTILTDFLGGNYIAGGAMKSTTGWDPPSNEGASNSSGFGGLPGGDRGYNGIFQNVGYWGYWWSSTPSVNNGAWRRGLLGGTSVVQQYNDQNFGFSVRCIRD